MCHWWTGSIKEARTLIASIPIALMYFLSGPSGNFTHSHCTVVQECCKDQLCRSMRKAEIWPIAMPKSLNQSSPNFARDKITLWIPTLCKISSRFLKGFLVSICMKLCEHVLGFFLFFWASCNSPQTKSHHQIVCTLCQMTRFHTNICLFTARKRSWWPIFMGLDNFQPKLHYSGYARERRVLVIIILAPWNLNIE